MIDLSTIKGIIFDLDGTLYEDSAHFNYFAERLATRLPQASRATFFADVEAAWNGRHALRFGRVYDRKEDLILQTTPDGQVLKVWTWHGEVIKAEKIARLYGIPIQFNMTEMISIGDGWWIPTACGYHHGIETTYDAYLETKDYLSSEGGKLTPIPGLAEWLIKLKADLKLVVVTNSDLADTKRILQSLNLATILPNIYSDAQKPQKATKIFRTVAEDLNLPPHSFLSIGDNYLNDVFPAAELGMQTILIDPHNLYGIDAADLVIRSLRELYLS